MMIGCSPGEYQHLPWSQLKKGLRQRERVTESPVKPTQSLHETVLRWLHFTAAAQWQNPSLYEHHPLDTGADNTHADLSYDSV